MLGASHRRSRSASPSLQSINSNESYGNTQPPLPLHQIPPVPLQQVPLQQERRFSDLRKGSIVNEPPPYAPHGWQNGLPDREPSKKKSRITLKKALIYTFFALVISAGFGFLIYYFRPLPSDKSLSKDDATLKELRFRIFLWLGISWGCLLLTNIFTIIFPYVFKFLSEQFNPGHAKYWHVFRFMRWPITLLGGAIALYSSYTYLVYNDKALRFNKKKDKAKPNTEVEELLVKLLKKHTTKPATKPWQWILNDICTMIMIWAIFYAIEKALVLYISVHYHYRTGGTRIESTKKMRRALVKLYEVSNKLIGPFQQPLQAEDTIIRSQSSVQSRLKARLRGHDRPEIGDLSFISRKLPLRKKTKIIIDEAIVHPEAAAALARRIWLSIVPEGRDILTPDDLIEVFGTNNLDDAADCFEAIDTNSNGDVTLQEFALSVIEAGKVHAAIYSGMTDITRALNILDWILMIVVAIIVLAYALLKYIPSLKSMQTAAGFAALGLSFGMGRTLHEFLAGVIYLFFKHPFDVGDRIELYNQTSMNKTSLVVKRVSILYTLFVRVDNGKDVQVSNDRLVVKRVENVSRSGLNREEVNLFVDFKTTFTDIQTIKGELSAFLAQNPRDYLPNCDVRLTSIFEMNKLGLSCAFTHKSNWSNEELRAARSSKFMCALLSCVRRIPNLKPGSLKADAPPNEDFEESTEQQAYEALTIIPVSTERQASGAEVDAWAGGQRHGFRQRKPGTIEEVF